MRILIEQDLFGIKPDQDEHELLLSAIEIQLNRHNKMIVDLSELSHYRFTRYLAGGYDRPRDGFGMEWTTMQPLIGALSFIALERRCTRDEAMRAGEMVEELLNAGSKYINIYLDSILAQHLDTQVDVTYVTND